MSDGGAALLRRVGDGHVTPVWVLHSTVRRCRGTIKKSETYEISGAGKRRAVAIWELAENKRQPLNKKLSAKNHHTIHEVQAAARGCFRFSYFPAIPDLVTKWRLPDLLFRVLPDVRAGMVDYAVFALISLGTAAAA